MSDRIVVDQLIGNWKQHAVYKDYFFCKDGQAAKKQGNKYILLSGIPVGRYKAISFANGTGKYKRDYLHRIICWLFNGPPNKDQPHCRHLDCNSKNNDASNLSWGTAKDNIHDGIKNGKLLSGEANPMSKLTMKQVLEIRKIRENTGATYKEIAQQFGVARMTIWRAINKETWK
jgi:HNH endonuclease/Homeodomain-like domain